MPLDAAFMYDAVRVYAQAADKVLRGGGDLRNGTQVVAAVIGDGHGSDYHSDLMGEKVHIDGSGDSEGNYILLAMVDEPLCNATNTSFLRVGRFTYNNKEMGPVSIPGLTSIANLWLIHVFSRNSSRRRCTARSFGPAVASPPRRLPAASTTSTAPAS